MELDFYNANGDVIIVELLQVLFFSFDLMERSSLPLRKRFVDAIS